MHIVKIELENVKSLRHFTWELEPSDAHAGWHVFLGDNGTGKSTLMRAVAIGMLSYRDVSGRGIFDMVGVGKRAAAIQIKAHINQTWDKRQLDSAISESVVENEFIISKQTHLLAFNSRGFATSEAAEGCFSASFGPQRRFTGSSQEAEKLAKGNPRIARHISIFGEDFAFTETLQWLKDLHYQQLDEKSNGLSDSPSEKFLTSLRAFINQDGFLPNGAKLADISPRGVVFFDPNQVKIDIADLSDGFRSILSLTIELIRQLSIEFGTERIFNHQASEVLPEGVVIVDEIDAHLHPKWQRAIGPWLTTHFPNIQFLVTTHSPLVCQGAVKGSVTRLPQPGSDDQGGRITGLALDRLLYGDILEAMSSGAFGEEVGRSDVAQEMLLELAKLNAKARRTTLDDASQTRRNALREIFALSAELES